MKTGVLKLSTQTDAGRVMLSLAVALAIIGVAGAPHLGAFVRGLSRLGLHPHGLDLALLARQPLQIKLHLAAALAALSLGAVLMVGPKGKAMHRTLGWVWAVAMGTAAVSSLFIRVVNHGQFSFIHLLSGWTIIALPMAVAFARRGNIARHRRAMMGLFYGGLVLAGALAFIPGRLMWTLFMG